MKIIEIGENNNYYLIGRKDISRVKAIYEIMDKLRLNNDDIVIVGKTSEEFRLFMM